jgi:hypothetical protein
MSNQVLDLVFKKRIANMLVFRNTTWGTHVILQVDHTNSDEPDVEIFYCDPDGSRFTPTRPLPKPWTHLYRIAVPKVSVAHTNFEIFTALEIFLMQSKGILLTETKITPPENPIQLIDNDLTIQEQNEWDMWAEKNGSTQSSLNTKYLKSLIDDDEDDADIIDWDKISHIEVIGLTNTDDVLCTIHNLDMNDESQLTAIFEPPRGKYPWQLVQVNHLMEPLKWAQYEDIDTIAAGTRMIITLEDANVEQYKELAAAWRDAGGLTRYVQ